MSNLQLPDQLWIYQQMMISAPFGMMLVDALQANFPIIYVNPAFEQITGYSAAEVMGKNSGFLQGMDRDQAAREAMRTAIEQGESCITVVRNYRKDGSLFWNEVSLAPLRDPSGVITYYFGTQKDVTAREEAKRTVERNEQRYRQMFDSDTAIKLVIDPATGNVKDANIAAAEFYGYTREQLRLLHLSDLNIYPRAQITSLLERVAIRQHTFLEVQHRLASGAIRDIDVYVSPVDTAEGRLLYAILIDVTGKRKTALEYQALFEQSNDAVFILDLEGNHRRVNLRAAEMFGYSVAELEDLSYHELVVPAEQPATVSMLDRLLHGEHLAPYERTFRRKDGTSIYAEVSIQLVCDGGDHPLHFQSMVRDITERKAYAEALRENEVKFRAVVEGSVDGIVLTNEVGSIIEWNMGMVMLSGLPAEKALGRKIWDIQFLLGLEANRTATIYASLKAQILAILQNGSGDWLSRPYDSIVQRPDGSLRTVQASLFPIKTVNGFRIGSILRDMTERHQLEETLREREEKYRLLAENTSDVIYLLNANRQFLYASPAVERMLGYSGGELLAMTPDEVTALTHPEDRSRVITQLRAAIVEKAINFGIERRLRHKNGHYLWTEDRATLQYSPTGDFLGAELVSRDVSARKQMEQALALSEARYRAVLEASIEAYYLLECVRDEFNEIVDFRIVQVNQNAIREMGLPEADLIGCLICERFPVNRSNGFFERYKRVVETGAALEEEYQIASEYTAPGWYRHQVTRVGDGVAIMNQNITEHKVVAEVLRESEEKYRALIKSSADGIMLTDESGTVVEWNTGMVTMSGLTAEAAVGRKIWDIQYRLVPDDKKSPAVYANLKTQTLAALQNGEAEWFGRPYDSVFTRTDGSLRMAQSHMFPITTVNGYRIGGIVRDITTRHQLEEALRASEERFRTIVDHIPVMISLYDHDGNFEFANRFWFDRFGWTLEELQSAGDSLILFYPDAEYRQQVLEYMLSGVQGWQDFQTMTKYRGPLQTSWWNVRLSDGRSLGIGQDITERHRMEQALRESEEKFRLVAENINDGVVIFDAHNRITYASPSYDRQYGRGVGESLRRDPERYTEGLHPDDREATISRFRQAIRNHEDTLTYSYRTRHSAGHYFWREDHARFKYAADGAYLGVYIVARNITERKRREEIEYKLRLEKDRLDMLTRFFSEAVHEFSTPLSTIATGIYLLSRSDDAQRRALKAKQMEEEIDRINRLLQSLVLIMKVENVDSSEISLINVGEIVQSECHLLQSRHHGQPVLRMDVAADLPAVMGYSDYLDHAFHELLGNAYRFTPADGTVTITVSRAEKQVVVDIHNTGAGIAEADLPYIFDTFWRKDEAHTTPGFGLGLAIAKRIIEQHGGTISATSEMGQGTRFRVSLPQAAHS